MCVVALVHCDAALMFDCKPLGYDGVYITTASCNATVCVPYTRIGARSVLPQKEKMKKSREEMTLLGSRTAVILATQTRYITNLLQTTLALIAKTSAQGRPALSTDVVSAWIRSITVPAPNSYQPLATATTTWTSIPTGETIRKTRGTTKSVSTSPVTPWEVLVTVTSTIASGFWSPVASLETTTADEASVVLTKLRLTLEVT